MKSIVLILLLVVTTSVVAQQTGPQNLSQLKESPAGSKILDYLGMVNSSEKVPDGWVEKRFAPKLLEAMSVEKIGGLIAESREMEGQMHLYDANRTGMFRYKLLLKGVKSGEWLSMVFTFEESDPYRILGITLDSSAAEPKNAKPIFPVNE
ncbi:MAG: hypothetical protein ABJP45_05040 [Cyclobacteriaceae bacterium]